MNDFVPMIKQFSQAMQSPAMQEQIGKLLPPDVSYDRFSRTTMVAINTNPEVLQADRQSLYNSISRAAADGLMPDNKDGALVIYSEKRGNGYVKAVRWMPMVEGIIKQMGKAGINAYAASVYETDSIEVWNDDSGQHIKHKPEPFKPRGALVGVYAVARTSTTTYVETLNTEEIDRVRASSKSGDRGPWASWYDRMAQKSALHRLKKRVPINDPAIVDSLRDPEEDAMLETPESATPDAPREKKRPRGLQAVVDQEPEPEPEMVVEPPEFENMNQSEEDVF